MTADPVANWDELQARYKDFQGHRWLFRGHRQSSWPLRPSLERVSQDRFGVPSSELRETEHRLKREFQRHYHRYSDTLMDPEDDLRWFGLMQHHGAPTRFLDWSYSFYVGVYFAAEKASPGTESAVWAVDLDWCWNRARDIVPGALMAKLDADDKDVTAHHELLGQDRPLVLPVNPFRIDERLALQQGVFLAPLDLSVSFMDNVHGMAGGADNPREHLRKIVIAWDGDFLKQGLIELHQMNISRRTLFPGLDGFATGLNNMIPLLPQQPLHHDR
jgi:FRG domain-containing protein